MVYCTQNAVFLEFGFGVTGKFTNRKGCGLRAKTMSQAQAGAYLPPSLAQRRLQEVKMCLCAHTH